MAIISETDRRRIEEEERIREQIRSKYLRKWILISAGVLASVLILVFGVIPGIYNLIRESEAEAKAAEAQRLAEAEANRRFAVAMLREMSAAEISASARTPPRSFVPVTELARMGLIDPEFAKEGYVYKGFVFKTEFADTARYKLWAINRQNDQDRYYISLSCIVFDKDDKVVDWQ